jgi:hypothetical protein
LARHGGRSQLPNLGPRLSIVNGQGKCIARLGGENGSVSRAASFWRRAASHWTNGDICVGEVGLTDWKTNFPNEEMPAVVRATCCLRKLERL